MIGPRTGTRNIALALAVLVGLLTAAVLAGCAGGAAPTSAWDVPTTPFAPVEGAAPQYDVRSDPWAKPAATVTVAIDLPQAARESLDLVTVTGRRRLANGSDVTLPVTGSDGGILGILVTRTDSRAAAVAYIPPAAEGAERTLSAREVTLGSVYISPTVLLAAGSERGAILAAASESPEMAPLVAETDRILASQPTGYLEAVVASGGFKKATELSVASSRAVARTRADIGTGLVPRIEDLPGQDLNLVNPRLTTYGYRIQRANGTILRDGVLYGRANYFDAVPRWPYLVRSEPVREPLALADGRYSISFYKGMGASVPESDMPYPETPWGKASLVNTLNLTTVVSDALGFFPNSDPDIEEWNRRVQDVLEALGEEADPRGLKANLEQMQLSSLILAVLDYSLGVDLTDLLLDLTGGIEDAGVAEGFFELMRDVYAITNQVYLAVQFVYTDLGFVYDLLGAPGSVIYEVNSEHGVLTEVTGG
ncbi:MAG: hypothetical protein ACOX6M_08125 [Armatimonadota bacterium]|jgi:hypothetical protein|nr:hypothetical protein [Acidobacteriota bacterium]